jgi:hypothetical protein
MRLQALRFGIFLHFLLDRLRQLGNSSRSCRCHSSCRRSRFSQLGTQIYEKRSFSINRRINCASWRSVFRLRTRLVRISAGWATKLPIACAVQAAISLKKTVPDMLGPICKNSPSNRRQN